MSGETEKDESGWTVDTLRYALTQQIEDLQTMLNERYQTQTKAVDAAFLAQQTAMQTALTAAERAVQTALAGAEKAVNKAEVASDKRFESVNEFRQQLADQAGQFVGKAEFDSQNQRILDRLAEITKQQDREAGKSAGMTALYAWGIAAVSLVVAVIVGANAVFGK